VVGGGSIGEAEAFNPDRIHSSIRLVRSPKGRPEHVLKDEEVSKARLGTS
jgi:hypothetical protein